MIFLGHLILFPKDDRPARQGMLLARRRSAVIIKERSETDVHHEQETLLDRFVVHVASGPDAGVARASDGPELSIGKAEGNNLVLSDPAVSRHHCTISPTSRGLLVRDLGSTNGTKVDGVRVESAYLRARSMVSIGDTVLIVQELADKLRQPLSPDMYFGPLIGKSQAMRRLFAVLPRIASSDSTVLIEGETGTGKGLLALALHQSGPRASGPFVVVDCASIPPALIESELFGHEKGAYTGATEQRIGAFEAARGGTVFLDEIGELPLELQPKLLRALEEREIKRIGSLDRVHLDVRMIAATNRDLRLEVNKQNFRSDLFYRLNILRLWLPPLRDRPEDLPVLIANFWDQLCGRGSAPPELVESFLRQTWPGNVRELRTAVERAVLLGDPKLFEHIAAVTRTDKIEIDDPLAPATLDLSVPFRVCKEAALARWEKKYLSELMDQFRGNISRASRGARMDRNHLRELLRRYGIAGGVEATRRLASISDDDTTDEISTPIPR